MKKIHDGERVRAALAKTDMTHAQLAEKIGVARSTLSRMLNEPSWRTDYLQKAGDVFGVNFFGIYIGTVSGDILVFTQLIMGSGNNDSK